MTRPRSGISSTDLLKDAGYKSQHATTGAEGIAAVAKQMPDLVMMDIKLPDQDGLAVLSS